MVRWSITHLEDMPALAVTSDADLKYDDGETRVWLKRGSPADDGSARGVVVEKLQADMTWKTVG